MSEREEKLIEFIDDKILEYEIEHIEHFANNDLQRAEDISINVYILITLKEVLKVKIKFSNNAEKLKADTSIQSLLVSMQKAIQNALRDIDDGFMNLDEDILHITRNNFEILYEYFNHFMEQ